MSDSQVIVRPPIQALVLVVALGGLFYLGGKLIENRGATTPTQPGTISVSGEGKVTTAPDIARLSLGVATGRKATATAVIDQLDKEMNAVIDAIKAQGVADKDIRTETFSLNPTYDWIDGRQVPRGFEGSQMLTVKVRNLDKAGAVLTAATQAGANDSGGVQFTIDDPEVQRQQARQEAIDEAKKRAEALAQQLGVSLGRLVQFSENSGGYTPPMYYMADYAKDARGEAAQSVPLPPGEQDTTVTVNLTYELR
jgi:uncharacterized protein YggE